jgi:tripartite-type tricarboxylate transporter receptor subunit TctC
MKRRFSGISERDVMKLPRRTFLHLAAGAAALSAASRIARAQAYPTRPIRLVIPFPPGGGYDAVGRPWADKMKMMLGSVIVENMGGGGSSLGAAAVARARPDGYTLLLGGSIPHVTESILKTRPLYDPIKDLEPISNIAVSAFAIAVHRQCRLAPSQSLSIMPRRIPASCPMPHPVLARYPT